MCGVMLPHVHLASPDHIQKEQSEVRITYPIVYIILQVTTMVISASQHLKTADEREVRLWT